MTRLAVLLATFGYAGFFPVAPGTVGSLFGLMIYFGVEQAGGGFTSQGMAIVLLFTMGVWAGMVA